SAGGFLPLLLFATMPPGRWVGESTRQTTRLVFNGGVRAAAVFAGIVSFLVEAGPAARPAATGDQLRDLGRALVGPFAAPLQLVGVLLVVALLGALYFARTED